MSDFVIENGVLTKYQGTAAEVTVPAGVTVIGMYAFEGCDTLTEVVIPEGVTHILDGAFLYCTALACVSLPRSLVHIGSFAFAECHALTGIAFPSPVELGYNALACTGLTAIALPQGLTTIPEGLFWRCRNLAGVRIPDTVTLIEAGAFDECDALADVVLAASDAIWQAKSAPDGPVAYEYRFASPREAAHLLTTKLAEKYLTRKEPYFFEKK